MTGTLTDQVGFETPNRREPSRRWAGASLELLASTALVVSTVVAATVVSIGMARADVPGTSTVGDPSFALAMLLGLVLGGWGWLTVLMARDAPPHND
jgi:hypothetical protein